MANGMDPTSGKTEEDFTEKQRLKAVLHYVIGKTYEDVATENGIVVNRQVMAAATELIFKMCTQLSLDLEMFAKHGKRNTINTEDLLLYCRRNSSLSQLISNEAELLKNEKQDDSKTKKIAPPVTVDEDDDDFN